jgi:IS605 OrfB family transposase
MIRRTVVFPINPNKKQAEAFNTTIKLYSKSWQHCVDVAWNMKRVSKYKLHNETYSFLKASLKLKSQYLCSSRDRAAEVVKSAKMLAKRGRNASKPSIDNIPIRLDRRTLSFKKDQTIASVTTQHGRVKISLFWHKHAKKYKTWLCKAGELGLDRKRRWVIRLIFEKKQDMPPKTGIVFGGDRGTKHPLVMSNNKFYGEAWWKEHERKLLFLISRLQSKGTKSAAKHLKNVFRRLKRFRENCDRVIAKEIIASLQPGDTIVLEILTNIRKHCGVKGKAHKKHSAKMGRWSFKRLENAIIYNAELNGIYLEYVNSHYTSQTCSRCNVVLKKNRKSQSLYSCSCGLNLNADLNAARNIAYKWCTANGNTSGLPVNKPIVANSSSCSVQLQASEFIQG